MVPVHPGGDPEVPRGRRSQKKSEKKISGKTGFAGSGFAGSVPRPQGAMGVLRATCSQNFRPLAALEAENFPSVTIIKYRIMLNLLPHFVQHGNCKKAKNRTLHNHPGGRGHKW